MFTSHSYTRLSLSTAAVLFLSLPVIALADEPPGLNFDEIEERAIDYRIKNCAVGSVELHVSSKRSNFGRPSLGRFVVVFDRDRIRVDQFHKSKNTTPSHWRVSNKYIQDGGHIVRKHGDDPNIAVTISVRDGQKNNEFGVFHPRGLGYSPMGINGLSETGLRTLLGRSDRVSLRVEQDTLEGRTVYRLYYKTKTDANVVVTVSPSQGYGVVRAEVNATSDGKAVSQWTSSELIQYPGGVWYPRTCEYRYSVGGHIVKQANITVERAEFGQPVDDSTFTLAGLGVSPGQSVNE